MKAITLWQPWASLLAVGAKKIETRSWSTTYRGKLAIHAGKGMAYDLMFEEPFWSTLADFHLPNNRILLPEGAVVATCNLVDCVQVRGAFRSALGPWVFLANGRNIEGKEYSFGDYRAGRYAWILEDVERLETPMPVRGHQGLWNFELPERVG